MATVMGIVRGHAGCLTVDSEPDVGTTARLLLPFSSEPVRAAGLRVEPAGAGPSSGLVLVVDDEPMVVTVTTKMLQRLGFEAIPANGGEEAVEIVRRRADEIALVILDMMMPGLSGLETLRRIREIRGDLRVILASGYSEADAGQLFRQVKLSGFMQKPFDLDTLRARVEAALPGGGQATGGDDQE
jgi:CheY-like chemotaxis protein